AHWRSAGGSWLEAEAARDDVALDFAGALADHIDEGVTVDAADRILAHDAGAAVDADGLFAHRQRAFAGHQLDAGRGGRIERALVDAPGAVVDEPAGGFDLRGHVGKLVRDGLVVADALARHQAV